MASSTANRPIQDFSNKTVRASRNSSNRRHIDTLASYAFRVPVCIRESQLVGSRYCQCLNRTLLGV
jgi:hypothetical protein